MKRRFPIRLMTVMLCVISLTSCFARRPGTSGRNERGMSPGPSGRLIGERDYRVPVLWINEPGQYGPGEYGRWMNFGGRERYYLAHVPPQYRPGQPTPLVFVLHGGGSNPDFVRYQSGMDDIANRNGFLAVYPAATAAMFKDRFLFWNAGVPSKNAKQRSVDDAAFISAVLDDVGQHFSVDPQRVYATGISNGAHMCYALAGRLYDRIAAIGPVAGQRQVGQYAPVPPGPMPVIHFHGAQDTWALFRGGRSNPDKSGFEQFDIAPAPEAVATWAAHNGCPAQPQESRVGNAVRWHYAPCAENADVVMWILEDGGHTWPGGRVSKTEERGGVGKINTDVSASAELWDFFSKHPKQ